MKKIILFIFTFFIFLNVNASDDVICTMDALECSDGTWVGRTGPNCEFVCPGDNSQKACTREYAPVCAEVQVQCFAAPCYPIKETFSNKCEMENNSLATFLHEGTCESSSGTITQIANPASTYCEENGGKISISEKTDGSQYGICYFDDNRQCEEWSLYRGECTVGGRKITGYIGEYAKYCAITGNEFVNKGQDANGDDIGDCKLLSGETIDAKTYYFSGVTDQEESFACPMIYLPVCGNDGETYGNSCMAQKVGVKYEGNCIGEKLETKVYDAWKKAVDKNLSKLSVEKTSSILEKVIYRAEKLASKYDFESVKSGLYKFIASLAGDTLHESIYEKYIKNNISSITSLKPTLGGKWYVTKIIWLDTNIAKVEYEDGHVVEKIKVQIKVVNGKIKVTNLEKTLEINTKYDNKDFSIKLKVPTSWEGNYEYKFLNDGVLQFSFKSVGEGNNMLFNLNLHNSSNWQKQVEEGLFNINELQRVGSYVISYSNSLDMPYTKDENINKYSSMIGDVNEVLESVEVSIK